MYQENERSLLLFACGWQEPDSIPSNVVIKNRKEKKRKDYEKKEYRRIESFQQSDHFSEVIQLYKSLRR